MGYLHMRINELMERAGVSKNKVCKDLDIPRANFNRYCRDEFQRIDAHLICKLCEYFQCEIQEVIEYVQDDK